MRSRSANILSLLGIACPVAGLLLLALTMAHKANATNSAVMLILVGVIFTLASRRTGGQRGE